MPSCDRASPGAFTGESFTHPPLKIIFRCSCSEKPIFIGLTSQPTGFAGDVCSVCLKEEQKTAKTFLLAFTLITERNKNGLFRSRPC
jgi:hypothetical protein